MREPPPRLPAAEADLDAWHAYAETLRDARDTDRRQRGELMRLDLALPALVDREQVAAYHRACHRLCRVRQATPTTWSLAHARDLAIHPSSGYPWQIAARSPEHGTFANAHDFLRSSPGARVEQLTTIWPSADDRRPWRRLMSSLPATCTTIGLLHQRHAVPVGELLASLPDTIRAVRVHQGHDFDRSRGWLALVDDRFDVVDIATPVSNAEDLRLLVEALARTSRVRLRVDAVIGPLRELARVVAGDPADPVLACADGSTIVLPSWTLADLERQHGHVPIRAQLARTLPERHGVVARRGDTYVLTSPSYGDLVRRGATWTLRGTHRQRDFLDDEAHHETAHNGRVLGESEIVPVADGDHLRFDHVECTFVDRAARAAAATT